MVGDAANAHDKLGWRHQTSFIALVKEVADDLAILKAQTSSQPATESAPRMAGSAVSQLGLFSRQLASH